MSHPIRSHLLGSTVLLATLTPAALHAQTADNRTAETPAAILLPELRVTGTGGDAADGLIAATSATGTKTDTPLRENPQSVSVVTREQMDAQGALSVSEALRYTPGVVAGLGNSDNRYDQITLRGFSVTTLGLFRDGLRQMSNQMTTRIEPFGLERVEVLRGPASVLYGQSAPGGLVNAVTKRPTDQPLHVLELQAGSHDRFQGAFDLGGAVTADGTLLYRLTGLVRDSDAQIDHTKDDRVYIAPALTWRPTDSTSLTLLTSYQKDEAGTPSPLPAVGTILPNAHGRIPKNRFSGDPALNSFDRRQYSAGWLFEHRLDDVWRLRQTTRYDRLEFDQTNVYAYTPLTATGTTVNRMAYRFGVDADLLGSDSQIQADWRTGPVAVTSLFGIDYRYNREGFYQFTGSAPPLNLYQPVYGQAIANPSALSADSVTRIDQIGLYTQQQAKVADRLVLTLGGRQDWARNRTTNNRTGQHTSQSDDAFTWRAGAAWLFDSGLTPYASYATSFAPVSGTDFAGRAFSPSEARQIEAGVKFQPSGLRSFLTAAWFDLTQTNVLTTDTTHTGFQVQTGEVRTRGVELQAVASLDDRLSLIGAYTWQDPEITKSNGADRGKRPTGVPRQMASGWADYTIPDGPLAGLGGGAGVRYVGATAGSADNSLTVPSVTLVDAAVRYDFGTWRAALNASNLFDRYYVANCSSYATCSIGYGRTVTASLRYAW